MNLYRYSSALFVLTAISLAQVEAQPGSLSKQRYDAAEQAEFINSQLTRPIIKHLKFSEGREITPRTVVGDNAAAISESVITAVMPELLDDASSLIAQAFTAPKLPNCLKSQTVEFKEQRTKPLSRPDLKEYRYYPDIVVLPDNIKIDSSIMGIDKRELFGLSAEYHYYNEQSIVSKKLHAFGIECLPTRLRFRGSTLSVDTGDNIFGDHDIGLRRKQIPPATRNRFMRAVHEAN